MDNVLWGGRVANPSIDDPDTLAIRRLNEKMHGDPRVFMSLVPVADGLALALKR